jgi:hypothetical protein
VIPHPSSRPTPSPDPNP